MKAEGAKLFVNDASDAMSIAETVTSSGIVSPAAREAGSKKPVVVGLWYWAAVDGGALHLEDERIEIRPFCCGSIGVPLVAGLTRHHHHLTVRRHAQAVRGRNARKAEKSAISERASLVIVIVVFCRHEHALPWHRREYKPARWRRKKQLVESSTQWFMIRSLRLRRSQQSDHNHRKATRQCPIAASARRLTLV